MGVHEFEFEVHDAFFEAREYSIIQSGHVKISLLLDKKETMLIGNFKLSGSIGANCDRCNDLMNVPIKGNYQIIYKFGTEQTDDESLFIIHPDAYEIDLKDTIYELITVSLPARIIHKNDSCDPEMIDLLNNYMLRSDVSSEFEDEEKKWNDEDE